MHESPLVARKENGIKLEEEVASKLTTSVGIRSVPEFQTFLEPFFTQVYNFSAEILFKFSWVQVLPVKTVALEGVDWKTVETKSRKQTKIVRSFNNCLHRLRESVSDVLHV